MNSQNNYNALANLVSTYKKDVIDIQQKLVAFAPLGPDNEGDGEKQKADFIKSLLEQLGADEIKELNAPDERVSCSYRPNLLALFYGDNRDKTTWIMVHTDVVPSGNLNNWNSDPFNVHVDGDKLIGRGVEDNNQGLVSALLAIKALKESNLKPATNIGLAIVADEETGSQYGLHYLLKNFKDEFKQDDMIIVPDAGDPEGKTIEVAEKSILWVKFHTTGKQCHASTPEQGINAFRAASHLVVKLDTLHKKFSHKDPVFDPPISTFEPTKKEANVPNVNTIPGEDVFYLDCRILPHYTIAEVEDKIGELLQETEREFNVTIETSYAQKEEAAPPTPIDAPVVLALQKAIKHVKNIDAETIGIGGGTVAALFRREGYNAAVWSTIEDTAHQPNEFSLVSSTISDAKVFLHVFMH